LERKNFFKDFISFGSQAKYQHSLGLELQPQASASAGRVGVAGGKMGVH
jgi:hypothetical protein